MTLPALSQTAGFPFRHGTRVKPSGRLPSVPERPDGTFIVGIRPKKNYYYIIIVNVTISAKKLSLDVVSKVVYFGAVLVSDDCVLRSPRISSQYHSILCVHITNSCIFSKVQKVQWMY